MNLSICCLALALLVQVTSLTSNERLLAAQEAQRQGNHQIAFTMYQKLSDEGLDIAQFSLAFLYEHGLGTQQSMKVACEYYLKAAQQKVPVALEKVGDCYINGILAEQSVEAKQPSQSGSVQPLQAQNLPPQVAGLSRTQALAFDFYLQANQSGIYAGACKAGELLMQTDNQSSKQRALSLCEEAAAKGSATAAYFLGQWFLEGKYITRDLSKAQAYFQASKPKTQPKAAFALGKLYDIYSAQVQNDDSLEAIKLAVYWYETAASQGYAQAYLPTSVLYWQIFTQLDKPEYLAKSYVWVNTAVYVSQANLEGMGAFQTKVNETVPADWKLSLDSQFQSHLQTFHTD